MGSLYLSVDFNKSSSVIYFVNATRDVNAVPAGGLIV